MVIIPKRITLVPQVAEVLRRGIRTREWVDRLPAEAALAAQLQVSRMTLRAGIKILVEEKRIKVAKGRRALILADRRPSGPARRGHLVGIILPEELAAPPFGVYFGAYGDILREAGFQTRHFTGLRFYQRDPAKPLEELLHEAKADFWVLAMSTAPMQRWFARRRIPVMVDGSCQPGVVLPALDVDYRAVCRHAAGTLLGLGHRQITLLSVKSRAGGDVASELGFAEGFRNFADSGGRPAVAYADDSIQAIRAMLGRLFHAEAPPTALLCCRVGVTLAAMSYLTNRGLRVPRDISIISRDSIAQLDYIIPAVSRYSFKPDSYARRLARMTIKHFDGTLGLEQQFILPSFARGESIGPAPR